MLLNPRPSRAYRSLALAALVATPASASDLEPFTVPIWTGAYAGLHGGANWLDVDTSLGQTFSFQSGLVGAHLGINYQYGGLVIGGEADLTYEMAEVSAAVDGADYGYSGIVAKATATQTASGSFRARLGVPIASSAMIYATGGYAWTTLDYKIAGVAAGTAFDAGSGSTFGGLVYGIGAEALVTPNIVLRIEALRYDYAEQTFSLPTGQETNLTIDPSSDVIRAGIS
jgi:outer membrane immunogenic protein